ncbi:MAG: regulator [Candidatus Thermoplasmatota archaeon]|jgi:predicted regulator of amino acid metabolism with ACT domain|uniref:regulator n=1 Tax=Ferroplasma sp. TaxID=2591003 RepID=UPI0017BF4E78|nr:regulator [Ferroplasma sp.]MCL4311770.1 regulator [Candidatus Thermoplasmatota archaeon]HII82077.1 regulator [Ferroplasma sp.]
MQLIFDEYFKAYPVKKKIVERLYANGISIVNNKFYVNNIEVSISSIASSIKVNRRTLYETIKFVNDNPVIKEVMENVSVIPDIKKISLLMENEIVTIYIDKGMYSRVTPEIMDAIEKYMSNIKEIYSVNSDYETNFIRLIFYNEVDESLFKIFNGIPGVNRILIDSPEKINVICDKCDIKICPHKISSSFREHNIYK